MRSWHIVIAWLRSVFFRGRREADLGEELQFHLDRETERLVAAGVDPHQARLQARRDVWRRRSGEGGEPRQPAARPSSTTWPATRGTPRGGCVRDWRFTAGGGAHSRARHRRERRDFQRDQRRALPAAGRRESRHPRGHLSERARRCPEPGSSYAAYLDMAAYTDIFAGSAVDLHSPSGHLRRRRPSPAGDRGEHVGRRTSTVLGLRPALGRWFTEAEDALNAPPVVVLGYRAWTTRFASDPAGRRAHHPDRGHAR